MNGTEKWVCTNRRCGWHGYQYMTARSPFDSNEIIVGCPKCKQAECIVEACDEPECWKQSSCGTNSQTGYRRTCSEHMPKLTKPSNKKKNVGPTLWNLTGVESVEDVPTEEASHEPVDKAASN